jgi:hypothetical protein
MVDRRRDDGEEDKDDMSDVEKLRMDQPWNRLASMLLTSYPCLRIGLSDKAMTAVIAA